MLSQAKLLRVLQSGEYYRVGGNKVQKANVRVIAATNEDLEKMVREGNFREDLLQRLQQIHLVVPQLAERQEDIKPIIDLTIAKSSKPYLTLSSDLLALLNRYDWPRNVRQLKDTISAMVIYSSAAELTIGDLPKTFFEKQNSPNSTKNEQSISTDGGERPIKVDSTLAFEQAEIDFGRKYIETAIDKLGGNVSGRKLAKYLKIPKGTLTRRLGQLGIKVKSSVDSKN